MAIRHVVTIQAAPGKAADLAGAFKALQAIAQQEDGCEQYELFQSLDDPDKLVLLERWASQALLDNHMEAERTRNSAAVDTPRGALGARHHPDHRTVRGLVAAIEDLMGRWAHEPFNRGRGTLARSGVLHRAWMELLITYVYGLGAYAAQRSRTA